MLTARPRLPDDFVRTIRDQVDQRRYCGRPLSRRKRRDRIVRQVAHLKSLLATPLISLAFLLSPATQALALSDDLIKQRIEERVAQEVELDAATVRIDVGEGFVVLAGEVRLYAHKLSFERIAWQTAGVEDVDNEIRVTPLVPLDDDAIEREIREIIKADSRFQGSGVKIRVESGAVFISATFRHPRDDIFLRRRVAEIEGVIAIEIDPKFLAWIRSSLATAS